jgi:long-chain acyl-CoA synthetase
MEYAAGGICAALFLKLRMGRPYYPERKGTYSVRTLTNEGDSNNNNAANKKLACWSNADRPNDFSTTPFPGCETVLDVFNYAVRTNGQRNAVGERKILKTEIDQKGFEKLTMSDTYDFITFAELNEKVASVSSGLIKSCNLKPKDKVVIYADTKQAWMTTAQAVFRTNATVVTIYATLGAEGVEHGVNETSASVIVCDGKLLKNVESIVANCPSVKHVVCLTDPEQSAMTKLPNGIKVHMFSDIEETGRKYKSDPVPPKSTDTAVIMYTSGTTGAPKGVVLAHSNVLASMAGLNDAADLSNQDVYLAYLPLAHIMEMAAECLMMALGAAIGYGSPQTLTDTGLKLAPGSRGDAPTLQPTFMVFAPAVLDRVRQAVQAKFAAASPLLQRLVNAGLAAGEREFHAGRIGSTAFFNALIFKKVQKLIGGRVRQMVSGSAPLSRETQIFMQTCFRCPVLQGYGLTETASCGTICQPGDFSASVGGVLTSTKIILKDWEEGNYSTKDENDAGIGMPRGEILIGGPVVCQGYYVPEGQSNADLENKNKTEFSIIDGVRYFHTGDIGQFTKKGQLQIIDRKKDLVKLQFGEYVALSKVENVLKQCAYVASAMCYALSSKSHVIALVIVNEAPVKKFAESNGISGSIESILKNPKVIAEVTSSAQAVCKGKLAKFEIPSKLALDNDPWTPDNDLVTAAFKLKRQNLVKKYKKELDAAYA